MQRGSWRTDRALALMFVAGPMIEIPVGYAHGRLDAWSWGAICLQAGAALMCGVRARTRFLHAAP